MPRYVRARSKGSLFFFTVVLAVRSSNLLVNEIDRLRQVYRTVQQRRPFETIAICVLPDHVHALWSLPEGDDDFSIRWSLIKSGFREALTQCRDPEAKSANEKRAFGSVDIGNMRFAATRTSSATSITSISIR
jgi:putative transposase